MCLADANSCNVPESGAGGDDRHWSLVAFQGVHIAQSGEWIRTIDYNMDDFCGQNDVGNLLKTTPPPPLNTTYRERLSHAYLLVSQMMAVLSTLPVTNILNGLQAARHLTAPSCPRR